MIDLFDLAKSTALTSPYRFRVGAVLVNNKIRISGTNQMDKTHPKSFRLDRNQYCGIHAEQFVLHKAKHHSVGSTLIIARVNRNNELALSKPCRLCFDLIVEAK